MGLFNTKLVTKTEDEFKAFGGIPENKSPLKERIGLYWDFLKRPDLDGSDNVPWSAAFVSYMVNLAGANTTFPYSAQHSVYFYRTINDKAIQKASAFWGYRVDEVPIEPGDIVGMNRSNKPPIDYDWAMTHADYFSHSDIVVAVEGKTIETIGGNVGKAPGEIDRKTFRFAGKKLQNASKTQEVFVVIKNFLP